MPPKKFNPKKATPEEIVSAIKSFDAESGDLKVDQIFEAMNQCIARGNLSSTSAGAQNMFEVAQSSNIFSESQMQKLSKSLYKADSKKAKAAEKKKGESSGFLKSEQGPEADEDDESDDEEDGASSLKDLEEDELGLIMMSDRNFKKTYRDLKESDREARFHIVRDKLAQSNPNIGQLLYLAYAFGIFQDFSIDEQSMMREWSEKQIEGQGFTGPQVISLFLWCPTLSENHALVRRVLTSSLQADNMGGIVALSRVFYFSPTESNSGSTNSADGGDGGDGGGAIFKSRGLMAQFLADRSVVPDPVQFILSYLQSLVSMRQEHRKPSLLTADSMLRLLGELLNSSSSENNEKVKITQEQMQEAKSILDKGRWCDRPHSFHRRMKELFGVFVERKSSKGKNKSRKESSRK